VSENFWQNISNAAAQMSLWELAAVLLSIAYILLALKEKRSCWYAAGISTAIYTVLFWDVSLLMDSALNAYYLLMAVYGWYQWGHGDNNQELAIQRLSVSKHLQMIGGVIVISLLSGYFLERYSSAAWPYLDSFTTWASVVTTWMLARKVLENWLYWVVIDAISIYLYIDRGLYLTAVLFAIYTLMAVAAYISWRHHYRADQQGSGKVSLCQA
jgi:nicotinamide mononucleotide transporter